MMKILLVLSLIANVVLGILYSQEKSQPPIERIILEQRDTQLVDKRPMVSSQVLPSAKKNKNEIFVDAPVLEGDGNLASQDYEDAVHQIETSKKDFLLQLGLSEDTLSQEGNLRSEFIRTTSKIYQDNLLGEASIADRRIILDLEEDLQRKVVKLYGKTNWEKFQKFQKKYNEQVIKKIKEDNGPAILMGP